MLDFEIPATQLTKTIALIDNLYVKRILCCILAGSENQYLFKIISLITSILVIRSQSNFETSFDR